MVPQHGAKLLQAGFQPAEPSPHGHRGLVLLHVGGQGAGAHVGLVAQNGVAHIVVVGNLDIVKENHIFQLRGVAHHAVGPHQGVAPDKGPGAHLGLRPDDAGPCNKVVGVNFGGFVDPHLFLGVVVLLLGEVLPQLPDKGADFWQSLPGIFHGLQQRRRRRVAQVI